MHPRDDHHNCIECRQVLTFDFGQVPDELVLEAARRLGIPPGSPSSLLEPVGTLHADPERLQKLLLELPMAAVVALEALLEAGGVLTLEALRKVLEHRMGLQREGQDQAIDALLYSFLSVRAHVAGIESLAVLCDDVPPLFSMVTGVSLPERKPRGAREAQARLEPDRERRDTVALVGLSLHLSLRITQNPDFHRSDIKRLGKGLGLAAEQLAEVTETLNVALHRGLFGMRGPHAVPDVPALLTFAERSVSPQWLRPFERWLDKRWLPLEALCRAQCVIENQDTAAVREAPHCVEWDAEALARRLETAGGFEIGECQRQLWVRRSKQVATPERTGDGHVTPSFEVMLGPAADLRTVAIVSLCCELTRLDHVLTFKLTAESVKNALSAGLEAEQIRSTMGLISSHPLPSNVEKVLEDFLGEKPPGRLLQGRFLFVDSEIAARIQAAAPEWVLQEPAPGVLWIDDAASGPQFDKLLSTHGIVSGQILDLEDGLHALRVAREGESRARRSSSRRAKGGFFGEMAALAEGFDDDDDYAYGYDYGGFDHPFGTRERSVGPRPDPDPKLRKAYLKCAASGDWGLPWQRPAGAGPTRRVGSPAPGSGASAGAAEPVEPERVLARMRTVALPAEALGAASEVERWARRLSGRARAEVDEALTMPLMLLPLLSLRPKWRRRILRKATDMASLLQKTAAMSDLERSEPWVVWVMPRILLELDPGDPVDRALVTMLTTGMPEVMRLVLESPKLAGNGAEGGDDPASSDPLPPTPRVGAMQRLERGELQRTLMEAQATGQLVHLEITAPGQKPEVKTLRIDGLKPRGPELAILGLDVYGEVLRVVPSGRVVAAELAGLIPPGFAEGESRLH
ncbi:MAG: helicase-associated domain-containing protein [Myxococcales bacterium]|nr:helicase-associated domain-containing protein [Myxococcales bacterium]